MSIDSTPSIFNAARTVPTQPPQGTRPSISFAFRMEVSATTGASGAGAGVGGSEEQPRTSPAAPTTAIHLFIGFLLAAVPTRTAAAARAIARAPRGRRLPRGGPPEGPRSSTAGRTPPAGPPRPRARAGARA